MTKNEILNHKVWQKMQAELDSFISEFKTKPPGELIESAYELIYKQDILQSFDFDVDGNYPLTDEQAKALLSMKNPLDYLYQEWLDYDDSVLDTLRQSNDFAIDKQIERLKTRAEKEREVR
ncbi:putative uncharacterized protein [Clostridium sp. CAG:678]|nr:putative uncharacterized protein [Clostridium sp. CAG:678]